MRDDKKPASLNELMGDAGSKPVTLASLPELLGEKMPSISFDRVGRLRLVNALHQRFGPGFRNVPGINDIMEQFDQRAMIHSVVKMNRRHR